MQHFASKFCIICMIKKFKRLRIISFYDAKTKLHDESRDKGFASGSTTDGEFGTYFKLFYFSSKTS